MEGHEEEVRGVASTQHAIKKMQVFETPLPAFSDEIKKCYFYFYEQLIAQGLAPDEPGYLLLMNITRRVVLSSDENNHSILNGNLEEFFRGLSHARLELQKDLLKIILGLLPPHQQSQVVNIILADENRNNTDIFARESSLGGQLARAVTDMEGYYQPYLDELLELQKLVEQHVDEFKEGLKPDTLEKLIQRMNGALETITTSVDVVSPLIKIVCKNIAEVSPSEDVGIHRIAGFFINRYLGGLLVKRNEALFSKSDMGELVRTSIIRYMLKFLQSLATTTESGKLEHLDSPFVETLTNGNRKKLVVFLKVLCRVDLVKKEAVKLQGKFDWQDLTRLEVNVAFLARYYTNYSLLHQFSFAQSPKLASPKRGSPRLGSRRGSWKGSPRQLISPPESPKQKKRSENVGTNVQSWSPRFKRTSSFTDSKLLWIQKQIEMNTTDPLKGTSILELMNELFEYINHNEDNDSIIRLYNDAYDLCMDFIFYHLEKSCRQLKLNSEGVDKNIWSSRSSSQDDPDKQENDREIILSNIDAYLTYITRVGQIRFGITYLVYHMSQANTQESNGPIYRRLYLSLMKVAFIKENEKNSESFENLVSCMNHWIAGHPDMQNVSTQATLLGDLLIEKPLNVEAFATLFQQEIKLTASGSASVIFNL